MEKENKIKRRDFVNKAMRIGIGTGLGAITLGLISRSVAARTVWQLDTSKCVQCGNCATSCVLQTSAVKCVHVTDMCGYCDLCSGFMRPSSKELTTAAENRLCPTGAISRRFIEEPYFEYVIDEELCNGCGKCVKSCGSFGNGSLQLQVKQDLCVNCNQCSIARTCPAQAYTRLDPKDPYILTGFDS